MLKRPSFPEVKLNLYLGDKIIFEGLNENECFDVRRQICENNLTGYYFKVDSPYWYLFPDYEEIHNDVAEICNDGIMNTWFPSYWTEAKGLYSESLSLVIALRQVQKKKEDENIHTETRPGV